MSSPTRRPASPSGELHRVRPAKILVVDDEAANRRLLADIVAHEGHEPLMAVGGAEALARLASEPVDLVLLDLMMPGVDGMAVLAELQKRRLLPALPVLVVTANDDRKSRLDALWAGAVDFITKPVDRLEIVCRIRTLVELRQLRETAVARIEGQLRESDHLLRLHFEQSPVAKITWDTSFHVVTWNPAAEKLFGYTSAEALGQHAAFVVPEHRRAVVADIWQALLRGRATESLGGDNITKDGRTIQCEWHSAPLTSADGTHLGVSSEVLDVTERTRLQSALAHSQKMDAVGQLAGGVAHDFNNILGVISAYAEMLGESLAGDAMQDDVEEIRLAARRGATLVSQLLTFSRKGVVQPVYLVVDDVVSGMENMLRRAAGPRVEMTFQLGARECGVLIDRGQLEQVLMNLVVNARDAVAVRSTDSRGRIVISTSLRPDAENELGVIELAVGDNGAGMDERTRARIFEPFFTTKGAEKGTGLGLSTVHGIVERARGRIGVISAPGEGTVFSIVLPRTPSPKPSVTAKAPLAVATRRTSFSDLGERAPGATIVLVEHDLAARRGTARLLRREGHNVIEIGRGEQALAMLRALGREIGLVITAIELPGMSGLELRRAVAAEAQSVPVMVLSGAGSDGVPLELPPRLWLQKPIVPHDLLARVREVIADNDGRTA